MKKFSFFSRLSGGTDQYDDYFDDQNAGHSVPLNGNRAGRDATHELPEPGGELAVDVYQTQEAIVVKALIAGVQPGNIDIALTREMLTVSGSREDEREVDESSYFQRELYWGSFSRTILLPEEIDVDLAEATEKHGVLVVRLPKINKKKQTKLKVRSR